MAFTVSHAVLAPILHYFTQRTLPIAALAIGCMAPDLYRLFTSENSNTTHLWRNIFYPTLWIGLAFCFIWYVIYRPALYRFLGLQDPIDLSSYKKNIFFFFMNMLAVLIGICTHLIWDGLTHVDFRTFILHDFLKQPVDLFGHVYPMHRVLQIGSSIVALPFLLWMTRHYYRKHQQQLPISPPVQYWGLTILVISLIIGSYFFFNYLNHLPISYIKAALYNVVGRAMNEFAQGFLISFSCGCLLFLFFDRGRRLG